jgi:hypothetical protein
MPLNPKQERYVRSFYPKLIEAIVALGRGDFVDRLPSLKPKGAGLRAVSFQLEYTLVDRFKLDLRVSNVLRSGRVPWQPARPVNLADWERDRYSLHYGRTFDDCTFRFDLDVPSGHHVHIQPTPHDHVPMADVTPDVRDLDPCDFVDLVAARRARIPLRPGEP